MGNFVRTKPSKKPYVSKACLEATCEIAKKNPEVTANPKPLRQIPRPSFFSNEISNEPIIKKAAPAKDCGVSVSSKKIRLRNKIKNGAVAPIRGPTLLTSLSAIALYMAHKPKKKLTPDIIKIK